jgi:outer membrane protein OmpA-like peptidoglycan-associated protein
MFWIWWTASALAQDALTFEAVRSAVHGEGVPSVTFQLHVDAQLNVRLACGQRRFDLSRSVVAGDRVALPLSGLSEGTHACRGEVTLVDASGAQGAMPLSLEVASLPEVTWSIDKVDLDLDANTLTTRPSRPLEAARLSVYGVSGLFEERDASLADPLRPMFRWDSEQEVVKLVVEGRDVHGFKSKLELSPWSYTIPHDDVLFSSGDAAIDTSEFPKLESTWNDVVATMNKYGSVVRIQLYVAGCTDTVGDPSMNQALSERRARAIAAWFRTRGFPGEVYFQGLGERAPAVVTSDEVNEPANRRAIYMLAADPPGPDSGVPFGRWRKL